VPTTRTVATSTDSIQPPTPRVRARTRRQARSQPGQQPAPQTLPDRPLTGPTARLVPTPAGEDGSEPATSFADLGVPDPLIAALAATGITAPFPIQVATIRDALAGRDVLGQGRTGSGKTLAFSLPLVTRLSSGSTTASRSPRGLVLSPTRELATQIADVIAPLAATCGLTVTTVFGGVPYGRQRAALQSGCDIVVACPGRLLDLHAEGSLSLASVEVCVIDEADMMADHGFLPSVRRILDATPSGGQRLLFSATLADGVGTLADRYLDRPVSHTVAGEAPPAATHQVTVVAEGRRVQVVAGLVGDGPAVVFCRTKHRARALARKLTALGVPAVELHGNLAQSARTRNLATFASGRAVALVATDIAARGIHVDGVATVVHADPPAEHTAYLHRSGRTARAGAVGEVVTVATDEQLTDTLRLMRRAKVDPRVVRA
jgi:superfamily II DNA/RNA helicase